MEEGRRRLAAIVAADVADYSRLMGDDEEGVIAALARLRADIVEPRLAEFHGRIANTAGDSFLIEFASAVDALRAAMAIQADITQSNADIPAPKRLRLRIGINLGDVVAQGEDLLGDGVNVAARLEAAAEPGGICVSRAVRDQVRDRVAVELEDMGEVAVKNIARPVRIFRIAGEAAPTPEAATPAKPRRRLVWALAAVALVAVVALGLTLWRFEQVAHRTDAGPSVAVLPFADMSDGADKAYFAAGVAEDIGTDLARIQGLRVAAPGAGKRFAGAAVEAAAAAEALKVGAVLEGGVRRADGRIRITVRLVDGATGAQLWAERYERADADLFAIQDDIAARVAGALAAHFDLPPPPRPPAVARRPNIDAYDAYVRGRAQRIPPTPSNLAAALALSEEAIRIDPDFAGGYAGASLVYSLAAFNPAPDPPADAQLAKALDYGRKAVERGDDFGPAHGAYAEALFRSGQPEEALKEVRRAMALAPNDALMRARYGRFLGWAGDAAAGIEQARIALRMSPDSLPPLYFLGANQRVAGDFDAAVASLEDHRVRLGGRVIEAPALQLAAAYAQAGRLDDAKTLVAALRKKSEAIDIAFARRTHPYVRAEDRDAFLAALREAGLPGE